KILRFLQERTIERVGGTVEIPVNVRVVSATHRDIQGMIAANEFREDLYFRIGEISVTLPPLRDRPGDVILLARALVARYAEGRNLRLSKDCMAAMEAWSWPGNIRELEN